MVNQIGDYAPIGDCRSLALVGLDGSIDWACFPRFDSPAVLCRVLDPDGGHCRVAPLGSRPVARRYVDDTNVLVTDFGGVEVTDFMPIPARHAIVRRIRAVRVAADVDVEVAPRFEYGAFRPRSTAVTDTVVDLVGGADGMLVETSLPITAIAGGARATWRLEPGDDAWVAISWRRSSDAPASLGDPRVLLDETARWWTGWMAGCAYDGDHAGAVRRSALVLKLLTYAPSGAVVAAGTTSLPEWVGGSRNWDYRYAWIRDGTLTLAALATLGLSDEAAHFKTWLERAGAGRPEDLQIMYGVGGERMLPEIELDHLRGHAGSVPVRIGNGAVKQMQLDAYGQILEAAWLFRRIGGLLTPQNWAFLSGLADIVATSWQRPDHGIWEMRDEPRHFVHSKLNCWVALDRALRLAAEHELAVGSSWAHERRALARWLVEEGAAPGWFQQAGGRAVADAATLLVPALGFLPTNDERVEATIDVVTRDLEHDGLVHRYRSPDGLGGQEGSFLLCSFWLLDCLTHAGRIDEADALLDRLLSLANDVGVYAEMIDSRDDTQLGNTPQAFTHMALVTSAAHLSAAHRNRLPPAGHAVDYTEAAVDRLLSR